nr:MAG: EAL domain-containing protein [Bacillota bacterium]
MPQPLSPGEEFLAQPALFRVITLRCGGHSVALRVHLRDASSPTASLQGQRLVEVAEILNHRRLRAVLQPVMDLRTGRIVGYEALLRGPEGSLERPDELFRAAEAAGILPALERAARETALQYGRWVLERGLELSLNIDARVPLLDDRCPLTGLLADGCWVRRVVLEVTERTVLNRDLDFLGALDRYRAAGGRVALDDLGAGDSGLQALLAIRPDMVKLDRALTAGMDRGGWRLALVEGLVAAAHRVGAVVVAEGIETVEDLRAARRAGVDYAQGYLVGRPSCQPPLTVGAEVLEALASLG